ncbi:16588_t:CDS:2 [Funneliformis caledonium]|uniref:16588_t:CDS:1 n=1 Tax=Funneliformis caledonium TaxID=1117310 RepID=A0A9N9BVN1_9GLOM|nr:16588_t:CDS:2 [Funneliformis caledonium]
MLPKKAPFYCLVLGKPETSAFPVRYNNNHTIGEIREIIEQKIGIPDQSKCQHSPPFADHIHLIVIILAVPITATGRVNVIIARLDKIVKNVEDMKREKSSIQI